MSKAKQRSICPISSTLDILGDKWSLLIVRDLMFAGKSFYQELRQSPERIASNILAERLARLESEYIIRKEPDVLDGRKYRYSLTDKGVDLMPILREMIDWGMKYNPDASYPRGMVDSIIQRLEHTRSTTDR